jgi:hemoglobin
MVNKPELDSDFKNTVAASLGITESMIATLVHTFYAKVRKDPFIGPIFQEKIGENWSDHLQTMCDFWSSVTIATGRYKGQPLPKHISLPSLREEHFSRWLELFTKNAYDTCPKEAAEFFIDKAKKIANSLMYGIAFYRGEENL